MAQTGYTPLQIYSSSTGGAAPAAGNLTNSTLGSELAINITDGKLFYKDNANAIQVIGWKTTPTTAGGTGLTSYTAGDLLYYATGTTLSKLAIGASTTVLTSSGTAPQWTAQSALSVGEALNLKSNATTGTMQIVGPGAGSTSVMTIPNANFTVARADTGQTLTGTNTFTYASGDYTVKVLNTQNAATGNGLYVQTRYNVAGNYVAKFVTNSGSNSVLTVEGNGNVTVDTGNLVIGTSGKGIDFSATSGAGTSELLADYEEGTWDCSLYDNTGLVDSQATSGQYIKVGNLVYATARIFNGSAFTATGPVYMNLPFAAGANTVNCATPVVYSVDSGNALGVYIADGAATANLSTASSNMLGSNVTTGATFTTGKRLYFCLVYSVI